MGLLNINNDVDGDDDDDDTRTPVSVANLITLSTNKQLLSKYAHYKILSTYFLIKFDNNYQFFKVVKIKFLSPLLTRV